MNLLKKSELLDDIARLNSLKISPRGIVLKIEGKPSRPKKGNLRQSAPSQSVEMLLKRLLRMFEPHPTLTKTFKHHDERFDDRGFRLTYHAETGLAARTSARALKILKDAGIVDVGHAVGEDRHLTMYIRLNVDRILQWNAAKPVRNESVTKINQERTKSESSSVSKGVSEQKAEAINCGVSISSLLAASAAAETSSGFSAESAAAVLVRDRKDNSSRTGGGIFSQTEDHVQAVNPEELDALVAAQNKRAEIIKDALFKGNLGPVASEVSQAVDFSTATCADLKAFCDLCKYPAPYFKIDLDMAKAINSFFCCGGVDADPQHNWRGIKTVGDLVKYWYRGLCKSIWAYRKDGLDRDIVGEAYAYHDDMAACAKSKDEAYRRQELLGFRNSRCFESFEPGIVLYGMDYGFSDSLLQSLARSARKYIIDRPYFCLTMMRAYPMAQKLFDISDSLKNHFVKQLKDAKTRIEVWLGLRSHYGLTDSESQEGLEKALQSLAWI
jgi:DNA-binding transcriptional ArsR family regulator